MKIHLVTVGQPRLAYAKAGWEEYIQRLKHYHTVRITHVADKWAYDTAYLQQVIGSSYKVVLDIPGVPYTSSQLAAFLEKRALEAREVCFIIGGPEGLPAEIIAGADTTWSLSRLTFPHDLAMVVLGEALYRASTITSGLPYHK